MLKELGQRLGFGRKANPFDAVARESLQAATALPVVAEPKVKANQQSIPSYLKSASPSKTSALPQTDSRLANIDLTTLRTQASTWATVRAFAQANPDLSAAVFAHTRTAVTDSYTAVAKNLDGTFNPEATALLQQLLVRFDILNDYGDGFSGTGSIRSISESLVKEAMYYGAICGELVLGKDRLPRRIQPLSAVNIKFRPDNGLLSPYQEIAGKKIDLDIPTFFFCALDQDLLEPYSNSPLESALQPAIFSLDFMNDVRRIVKRAIHPRLAIKVDEGLLAKQVPSDILHDSKAVKAWAETFVSDIETKVNALNPEDALIYRSTMDIDYLNNGNTSLSKEYEVLSGMADAKMATGAKTLPAILGHGVGSSNIASSETLLFMKYAQGIQGKLNEFYSRLLTLAVRLFGQDVYVEFKYANIDLRPESELEAFRAQKQSRVLELLSLGLYTDEEASLQLTGRLPPAGFKPLSGSMFKSKAADGNANPNGDPNNGSTLNQNLNGDAPKGTRGGNNKADPQKTKADGNVIELR